MRIKVKEVTKTVPCLVDPEPGWMSLVSNGANQTPFNSLKSQSGQPQEKANMAKGKGAKRDGVLTRINFSKDVFSTQKAVEKFLEDNNITGCEVIDDSDVWAAKSTTLDGLDLEKPTSMTTKHAGVTMFVAAVKETTDEDGADDEDEDEDGAEPEANADGDEPKEPVVVEDGADKAAKGGTKAKTVDGKAAKAKTGKSDVNVINADDDGADDDADDTDTQLKFPANKYDWWAGYMSNEGSLLGVLKDGIDYDGLPPGVDEVMSAVYTSAGNVLSSSDTPAEKKSKLAQIGEDFAALTFGLFELFDQATEDATKSANSDRRAKAAAYVESFRDSVTRAAKGEFGPSNTNTATPSTKGVDEADGDEGADDAPKPLTQADLDAAVAKAVAPLNAELRRTRESLTRSAPPRSDQSIIDDLAGGDDDEEDEAETARRNAAKADFRSMFGIGAPAQ